MSTRTNRLEQAEIEAAASSYLETVASVSHRLGVAVEVGLARAEAAQRLATQGSNEIIEQRRRSAWRMLLDQFTDFMILVLIAAAVVSGLVGEASDTIAIVVILILNGIIGFVQEYRAERAVAALKRMAAANAVVRRDGEIGTITAIDLVAGDVVLVEAGDVVPADLRLAEVAQLKIDESALTGESVPVEKITLPLSERDLPLGDRLNLVFKGTSVSGGRGTGIVVATGMATELGRIAALLSEEKDRQTPLQKRLAAFGRRLVFIVLAICAIVFAFGLLRGEPTVLMFLTAVSLAVAAIPEALPAVVTVSLALGARRMVRKNVLVRRLAAVETLGSVTGICSDKTGTLTQNRMRVQHLSAVDSDGAREPHSALLTALALCNDASRGGTGEYRGDPTEVALHQAADEAGFRKEVILAASPRVAEIPFDADRKCMTTLHQDGAAYISFTKGAPEYVVRRCGQTRHADGEGAFAAEGILRQADELAAAGLRVLAVACRHWPEFPEDMSPDNVELQMTLLGLAGLIDPARPEARDAVATCKAAGITPVMITGDHPATAAAIATQLGIIDGNGEVLTGQQLDQLSSAQIEAHVERVRVYARVAPEQKIKIVKALQDKGEFVAMTGDGVNDAPALKRADIGVAMGKIGTEVAREAADMVLLDDNFASIVAAVREGRRIFDNMRKFIRYGVTCNAGEIWTIFLAPFLGLPIPLLPLHILWINLVTDGLPGLALAAEPAEKGIMQRPPRPPREGMFAHGLGAHILWVGLLMAGVSLLTQAWAYHSGSRHWQTMVFTVLALSQMGHVLAIRSERDSLFRLGLFSNRPLIGAVVLTFALQLATIYVPALNPVFKTEPLTAAELAISLILSSVVFVAVEIEKGLVRRGRIYTS